MATYNNATVRAQATNRAQTLLDSLLTPEQRERWATRKWTIEEPGAHGCIYILWSAGAYRKTPKGIEHFCVHSRWYGYEPIADSLVAMLLALRADEKRFLKRCHLYYTERGGTYLYNQKPWWPDPEPKKAPAKKKVAKKKVAAKKAAKKPVKKAAAKKQAKSGAKRSKS